MQSRILVREQGQKKRFISPTQMKQNQMLYGDIIGLQRSIGSTQMIGGDKKKISTIQGSQGGEYERNSRQYFSPQHNTSEALGFKNQANRQRSRPIHNQIGVNGGHLEGKVQSNGNKKQKMESVYNQKKVSQGNSFNNESGSKISSNQIKPSISKNSLHQTSKSKDSKKDYMASTLARFNKKHKTHQKTQSQQFSISNQSSSQVYTKPQPVKQKTSNVQYNVRKNEQKNIYNDKINDQRQKIKRRKRNDDSLSSDKNFKDSSSGIGQRGNYKEIENKEVRRQERKQEKREVRQYDSEREIKVSKDMNLMMRQGVQKKYNKTQYQQRNVPEPLQNQQPRHQNQIQNQNQNDIKFKTHTPTPKQTNYSSSYENINTQPNNLNSTTLIHQLQKAHQQKQNLRQKKLLLQSQTQTNKQYIQHLQSTISSLRKQLQQTHVQKLSLQSQLKYIKQSSNQSSNQLNEINSRNENVYRQINQKYLKLVEDYRKVVGENDELQKMNSDLRIEVRNLQNKMNMEENKNRELQSLNMRIQDENKLQVKKIINQWRSKLQQKQNQLKSKTNLNSHDEFIQFQGQKPVNIKIKLIQLQSQLNNKKQLILKKQQEIKRVKREYQQRVDLLEEIIRKKDGEIREMESERRKGQEEIVKKGMKDQQVIKELQIKCNGLQKQLKKNKINAVSNTQQKQSHYQSSSSASSTNQHSKQSHQAQQSINSLIQAHSQQITQYKTKLNRQIQQTYKIKSQLQTKQYAINNLHQQLNILRKQNQILQKKVGESASTDSMIYKTQIENLQKRMKSLESKIMWNEKELKEKDGFIQANLLRGVKEENVPKMLEMLKEINNNNRKYNGGMGD